MESFKPNKQELGVRTVEVTDQNYTLINEVMRVKRKEIESSQSDCQKEFPETFELLKSWLDSIDYHVLSEVFEEYAEKSGVPGGRMNFPPREDIYLIKPGDDYPINAAMSFSGLHNLIEINMQFQDHELALDKSPQGWAVLYVYFLRRLFHEYAHATSRFEYKVIPYEDDDSIHIRREDVSGISTAKSEGEFDKEMNLKNQKNYESFNFLNEGITERIADEVLREYLTRSPTPKILPDMKNRDVLDIMTKIDMRKGDNYGNERTFLISLTKALAEEAGVPESVVWRGFVKQYYSGELDKMELPKLLVTTFGIDIALRIQKAEQSHNAGEITSRDFRLEIARSNSLNEWLEHLEVARGAK